MKILIITNLFYPDELAGAALFTDLTQFLHESGHDIRVLTTFPYYPAWKVREHDVGVSIRDEVWREVPIRRISMYVPEAPSGLKRMLSDFSFLRSILKNYRFGKWKPDVILTASPMFSQCLAQRFIYPFLGIPRMIAVQDFVVDAALELGILKFPFIKYPLRWLEKWSLRSAMTLSTISSPMLSKLGGIVGNDRNLKLIPNWIHQGLTEEMEKQCAKGLPKRNQCRLLYSGNLGVKQGLPQFAKVFSKSRGEWNLDIHGGGAELEKLESLIREHSGISLGSVLPEDQYVAKLLACSACLVTQMPGVGANFLPSKLLPALAAGAPVLAVCEADSPLGQEVVRGKFGEVIPMNDESHLRIVLEKWQNTPALLDFYSTNARDWAKNYSRDRILKLYENELLELCKKVNK